MAAKCLLICLLAACCLSGYVQVFNDNFANLNNWVAEVKSGHDTGNNELEYYTNRAVNVYTASTSYGQALVLHAQKESYQGYSYTSGRVHSAKQFGPYGFFNVKAIVPKGNGIWPAIWMLPIGNSPYGAWAACGEIDIMETVCTDAPGYATLHYGGPYPHNVQGPPNNKYPMNVNWSQPHYYGVEWTATYIRFWFDAQIVNGAIQGTQISYIASSTWYSEKSDGQHYPGNAPFNTPFNFILNVAIGGNWPCSHSGCCSNIAVPASMYVFNVQVWEQSKSSEEEEITIE